MAKKILLVIGSVWGRLTVLEEAEPLVFRRGGTFGSTYEKRRAVCRCECDKKTIVIVRQDQMRSGKTRSCGCLHDERARAHMTAMDKRGNKHRQTHGRTNTPEFYIWHSMNQRCTNPKQHSFPRYGGRGITVCARWLHTFENFLADMGERPTPQHTLERNDNDGNYEPANCRWATPAEQGVNRGTNKFLTYRGETLCLTEWARRLGMNRGAIQKRLHKGWSVEDALTTPALPRELRHIKRQ